MHPCRVSPQRRDRGDALTYARAVVLSVMFWSCGSSDGADDPGSCPENSTRDDGGACLCDVGYEPARPPCRSVCPPRAVFDSGRCECPINSQLGATGCECDTGYAWREDGSCQPEMQLRSCCECLDRTRDTNGVDSCLPVSVQTCEDQSATVIASCYCWEQCHAYCLDTLYPYEEAPSGCQH